MTWRQFWRDFVDGYRYVKDPSGWWANYRRQRRLKFAPRPTIIQMGDLLLVHPALYQRISAELAKTERKLPDPWLSSFGLRVVVSPYVAKSAPAAGWPDVTVPEQPRWTR